MAVYSVLLFRLLKLMPLVLIAVIFPLASILISSVKSICSFPAIIYASVNLISVASLKTVLPSYLNLPDIKPLLIESVSNEPLILITGCPGITNDGAVTFVEPNNA